MLAATSYEDEILAWRKEREDSLRSDEGWLTLVGLFWLHEGENTVGANAACDIPLPENSVPEQVGILTFHDGNVTLRVTCAEPVTVDGERLEDAILRDDSSEQGASKIAIRDITFFVIRRGDEYGIRVRDKNHPARQTFGGRKWFTINPAYRLRATFTAYAEARSFSIVNTVGITTQSDNPGTLDFTLNGQTLRLQALAAGDEQLWLIFKDATSGKQTYGAGRYLYAKRLEDDFYELDFNRAYHPPCAFTQFATCPLPPRENTLPLAIEAGERL